MNGALPPSLAEAEILALSLRKFAWKTAGEWDEIEALFDEDLVFIHITGRITSKREWLAELRSGRFAYTDIEQHEAGARLYDNIAVLVGRATFTVTMAGRRAVYPLVYTEVYRKVDARWSLINLHTTAD